MIMTSLAISCGEFAPGFVDQLADLVPVDAEDRRRFLIGEALQGDQKKGLARKRREPGQPLFGRPAVVDRVGASLTESEFQMRAKAR